VFEAWLAEVRAEAPILAGSAAVVAFMVAVAWLIGFRAKVTLVDADLQRLAASEGATIECAAIAPNGKGALALLSGDKAMIARVMGADISARVAPRAALHLRRRAGRLEAAFADLGFPPLNMRLTDSPAWLSALAGEG